MNFFRQHLWVIYVCKASFKGFLVAMSGIAALFTLLEFIARLNMVGDGSYTIFDDMLQSVLVLPSKLNQMAPMGMLLGTMLGLGRLAAAQELVALMATGIFAWRVILAVSMLIIPINLGLVLSSQYLLPRTQYYVMQIQYKADPPDVSKEAVWDHQDHAFLRVGRLGSKHAVHKKHMLYNVEYYQFDKYRTLQTFIKAKSAEIDKHGNLELSNVLLKRKVANHFSTQHLRKMPWHYDVTYWHLQRLSRRPQDLSNWALLRTIITARNEGTKNPMAEQELWDRAMIPVTMVALLYCTVPFLFGVARGTSMGVRIGCGVLIAVGYTLAQEIIERTAFVSNINPLIGAILPPLILGVLAVHFYAKTMEGQERQDVRRIKTSLKLLEKRVNKFLSDRWKTN